MAAGLYGSFDIGVRPAVVAGIGLGAVATVSATAGVAVVARQLGRRSPVVQQLEVVSATNAVAAILASGLLFAIVHPDPNAAGVGRPMTPTEWVVVTIAIGVVGGPLFHLFVGDERKVDRLFVSRGALVLVSGAATYLRALAAARGALLRRGPRQHDACASEITVALERVERPLYFALLVLAGATWQPSMREWVLPGPALPRSCASRRSRRGATGARSGTGCCPARVTLGPRAARAGRARLAIALSYLYQSGAPLSNLVFTAAVASVLLTDLLSARLVRHRHEPLRRSLTCVGSSSSLCSSARCSSSSRSARPATVRSGC